jgi:hypothetical protein
MSRLLFRWTLWILLGIATLGVCTFVCAMVIIAEADRTE